MTTIAERLEQVTGKICGHGFRTMHVQTGVKEDLKEISRLLSSGASPKDDFDVADNISNEVAEVKKGSEEKNSEEKVISNDEIQYEVNSVTKKAKKAE